VLARVLRVVGARFAPLALGPVVAGDGEKSATWRLRGERGELELTVEQNPGTGLVTKLTLVQRPPVGPPHDD
jgi:hypothetical protein